MSAITSVLEKMQGIKSLALGQPATEAAIARFSAATGLELPEDYVGFLRRCSYASWFGREVYGIDRPDLEHLDPGQYPDLDAMRRTLSIRRALRDHDSFGVVSAGIVISEDGGGGVHLLVGPPSSKVAQIHHYNFGDQEDPIRTWGTFAEYLDYFVEVALRRGK